MSRYDNDTNENYGGTMRQKDLVLATNEFVYVQDRTSGSIRTYTGPTMLPISQQQALVVFDSKNKIFKETSDFSAAKQLFVSAPEGWYVVLKNPAKDNVHPNPGSASNNPELEIGKKINISGPVSFSLYPGQMARVIQGHKLRSNQYLIARVYDADAANENIATVVDTKGETITTSEKYFVGQLLVIKGTEVSFYIPPTGIEVIKNEKDEYVREAITLERLEYAILKDENGSKTYSHGPAVVFPKPTETFVKAPKGGAIFRALELSPISGIYVKVIAEYEEDGVKHPIGEELFITGKDQMIYYPRPEHAMIQYDGKYMHHAIAIPEGEGRYVLNRLTGEIKVVKGYQMYLPDPRTEVVVKRKLSDKECELLYPGNTEVLTYNRGLSEKEAEKRAREGKTNSTDIINMAYATSNQEKTLAIFEANSNISRGVSYTKPRTIVLDTKYDGVVTVDVWTGYAVNVVSKSGKREVVVGPQTRLLEYDETLEAVYNTSEMISSSTAFLKTKNNKITDSINAKTKDFVDVCVQVTYNVDFNDKYKNNWFTIKDYADYLRNKMSSIVKDEIKKYNIEDFLENSENIIKDVVLDTKTEKSEGAIYGRLFTENGMVISDVNVTSVQVEKEIAKILNRKQASLVAQSIELSTAEKENCIEKQLAVFTKENAKVKHEAKIYELNLNTEFTTKKLADDEAIAETKRAQEAAAAKAESDMQEVLNAINKEKIARQNEVNNARIEMSKKEVEIEKTREEAYAATVEKIMSSIGPDLAASLSSNANAEITKAISQAVSPYAMARGESISDTVSTLLRGTSIEQILNNLNHGETNS